MRRAAADIECTLHEIARLPDPFRIDRADHNINGVFLETLELSELPHRNHLAVDEKRVEPLALRPARYVGVKSLPRFHERREHFQRPALHRRLELADNRGNALFLDRQIAVRAKLRSGFRKQEPEKMVNLGDRGDGRLSPAARDALP